MKKLEEMEKANNWENWDRPGMTPIEKTLFDIDHSARFLFCLSWMRRAAELMKQIKVGDVIYPKRGMDALLKELEE